MLKRFTERAIKVITLAHEESRRLGHSFIGKEQILLGLIAEGTGVASKTFGSMGVTIREARKEVEKIVGRGTDFGDDQILFTPEAQRVLECSRAEAKKQGYAFVGTLHLLLGLLRECEESDAEIFESLGVDITKVKSSVLRMQIVQSLL